MQQHADGEVDSVFEGLRFASEADTATVAGQDVDAFFGMWNR